MWDAWDWFKDNTLWVILGLMFVSGIYTAASRAWTRRQAWVLERRQMAREKHAKKMERLPQD